MREVISFKKDKDAMALNLKDRKCSVEPSDDNINNVNNLEYMIDKSHSRSSFDSGDFNKPSNLNRMNANSNISHK